MLLQTFLPIEAFRKKRLEPTCVPSVAYVAGVTEGRGVKACFQSLAVSWSWGTTQALGSRCPELFNCTGFCCCSQGYSGSTSQLFTMPHGNSLDGFLSLCSSASINQSINQSINKWDGKAKAQMCPGSVSVTSRMKASNGNTCTLITNTLITFNSCLLRILSVNPVTLLVSSVYSRT